MEIGSGKGTEGGTGKESDLSNDQILLSDLRRELDTLRIELGNWMDGASGQDQATVRALIWRERSLRSNYESLLRDFRASLVEPSNP